MDKGMRRGSKQLAHPPPGGSAATSGIGKREPLDTPPEAGALEGRKERNMRALKLCVVAGVVLALGSTSWALSLRLGEFNMNINNWDVGTEYDTNGNVVSLALGGWNLTQDIPWDPQTANPGDVAEDSWGIFRIQSITHVASTDIIWSDYGTGSTSGTELTGIFYGTDDLTVAFDAGDLEFTITAQTFHFDLWENPYDSLDDAGGAAQGTGGRIDLDEYEGITDAGGSLIVSALSRAGGIAGNPEYLVTVDADWDKGTFTTYADVTGGTQAANFDTDGELGGSDLYIDGDLDPTNVADWDFFSSDPVKGNIIPEPATMLAVFAGLSGLAGYVRRRRRA